MRTYLAKINLTEAHKTMSTGAIGEDVFKTWFNTNFQGEKIFSQLADRDFKGIDFADEKGITYQVKTTRGRTYTFNCDLSELRDHLKADKYICIQIKEKYAYIEHTYDSGNIIKIAQKSYIPSGGCFIWAKDLLQYKLEI